MVKEQDDQFQTLIKSLYDIIQWAWSRRKLISLSYAHIGISIYLVIETNIKIRALRVWGSGHIVSMVCVLCTTQIIKQKSLSLPVKILIFKNAFCNKSAECWSFIYSVWCLFFIFCSYLVTLRHCSCLCAHSWQAHRGLQGMPEIKLSLATANSHLLCYYSSSSGVYFSFS